MESVLFLVSNIQQHLLLLKLRCFDAREELTAVLGCHLGVQRSLQVN